TVLFTTPNVPADVALNGWPGCTRLACVGLSPEPGNALGSVAGGVAKVVLLNRVNTSTRSSAFGPRPGGMRLATTRSIWWKPGPWMAFRSRLPKVPGSGVANAAGFRNRRPPSSMNGSTPGTTSGRRVARDAPPAGTLMTAVRPAAALVQTAPD